MNNSPAKSPDNQTTRDERLTRNAYATVIIFIASIIPTIALFGYFGFANDQWQLLLVAGVLSVILLVDFNLLPLVRNGRSNLAMMVLMTNFVIAVLSAELLVNGLGMVITIASMLIIIGITSLTMSSRYTLAGIITAAAVGLGFFILDNVYTGERLTVPQIAMYSPYITAMMGLGFFALGIREFNRLSLRIKIALGILATGAITVGVLVLFGTDRVNNITSYLIKQYKDSNAQNIRQRITLEADSNAKQTNEFFSALLGEAKILAEARASLEAQKETLNVGSYWNANERVFQMAGGQYGNQPTDPASIFIPSTVRVDEALLADLNTTAYFDFYALNYIKSHPEIIAVYFISKAGATTYYPNIDLANNVPPNFDPREQPFYAISNPAAGATNREPRWVRAYQDPAGQGLLVTLSAPVYFNDRFLGVIGVDIQLEKILTRLDTIKIDRAGYAFLVDENGRVLAMPADGYDLFGIQKENIPASQSPEQTIADRGAEELKIASARMINGETGVALINHNNENFYFAFAPLTTPNYRFGFVVPEKQFIINIIQSENEAQRQIENIQRAISIILITLFIGALLISLLVGQIITRPLVRLTETVETISKGDLTARAAVVTQDETGILARAFNNMADRLGQSMSNLEERVSERTLELEKVNETNARRASKFEAVARVSRAISSTQTLETLLPKIVETISMQFGFYHVGIFLLDNRHEYAILVAANSVGGQRMLARNHRLMVGETGIVGYVTRVGQPRVALDVGQDATYFNNPDLPETHSEIALPLRIGADIFGALDVQSTEANAFSEEDINILSTLADQVSIAIQNARSYQQSREALAQAERISLQLSGRQWKRFIEDQKVSGYYFDGTDTKAISPERKQRAHNLSIPLTLRGANIGAIKISPSNPNHEWTDDEIAMVQAAAERASLALENARLLEESQKRAAKERTIGEISAKIGGLTDLESIIQTAIQELGNTLPSTEIAVQFMKE